MSRRLSDPDVACVLLAPVRLRRRTAPVDVGGSDAQAAGLRKSFCQAHQGTTCAAEPRSPQMRDRKARGDKHFVGGGNGQRAGAHRASSSKSGIDVDALLAKRKEMAEKQRARGQAVNAALDGQIVRMPGYVLPLEFSGKLRERISSRALGRGLHPYPAAAAQSDRACEDGQTVRIRRPVLAGLGHRPMSYGRGQEIACPSSTARPTSTSATRCRRPKWSPTSR